MLHCTTEIIVDDQLNAEKMKGGPGGKQPILRDTVNVDKQVKEYKPIEE